MKEIELVVTDHASKRLRERLNAKHSNLEKIVARAYISGIKYKNTKGYLKKYITKLFLRYKTASNIRIYNESIFFFKGRKLITVYHVPSSLKKYLYV